MLQKLLPQFSYNMQDRTAADKKHVAYCDPPQAGELRFAGFFK